MFGMTVATKSEQIFPQRTSAQLLLRLEQTFCWTETKYFIRVKLISGSIGLPTLFQRQSLLDEIDWLIRWKFHNILSLQKLYSVEWNWKMIV